MLVFLVCRLLIPIEFLIQFEMHRMNDMKAINAQEAKIIRQYKNRECKMAITPKHVPEINIKIRKMWNSTPPGYPQGTPQCTPMVLPTEYAAGYPPWYPQGTPSEYPRIYFIANY